VARICIVTPSALGSNPRVVKEAQVLTQAGHDVHVISTSSLELVDRRDEEILAQARWSSERIDLRRGRIVRKLRQLLLRQFGQLFGSAEDGYAPAVAELSRRAAAWPAQLYIAHYVAALPAAARAARRHGARLAYDAEDFHLGDPPEGPAFEPERRAIRGVEARHLPNCAYVTAASPGIAQAYADAYGIAAPPVVLNVFPREDAVITATRAGAARPGPSVYWFSQTIGPDRGLECAVRAIAKARTKPHLYLRGDPAHGYRDEIVGLAASLGVTDRLHLLDPAAPSQMTPLAAQYDLGLVAETGFTPNHRIALSNKQFTYLLAGVPALLSDTPGHTAFARMAEGAAFVFRSEDEHSLAAEIDALLGDAAALANARACALEWGLSRFNWDVEQTRLLDCVKAALERPPQ
jgi:glycosyltransferase involved in cell wall biosynthesis